MKTGIRLEDSALNRDIKPQPPDKARLALITSLVYAALRWLLVRLEGKYAAQYEDEIRQRLSRLEVLCLDESLVVRPRPWLMTSSGTNRAE